MNKKKIITDIFIISFALALFIMWSQTKLKDAIITSQAPKNYKIYLITMDKTDQFWHTLNDGVSKMANLIGIQYIWDAPVKRNVDAQIELIRNATKSGANALMIAASDPVKATTVIEDAKALGVKIIYVDSPANTDGIVTLATDNYLAGTTAGKNMIDQLEELGITKGSIGIIGVTLESVTTIDRERGFRSVLEADGRFTLLKSQYAAGNQKLAAKFANDFIKNNPDLIGLFGANELATEAIGEAIKTNNKNVIGIGFDITSTIQQYIDEGYLKAVMVQNPFTMGYLGMAETIAALNGYDTGPNFINTGIDVKTRFTH